MNYLSVEGNIEIILIYGESARNVDGADRPRSRATIHRIVKQFTTKEV